jgi:hypothetical protein
MQYLKTEQERLFLLKVWPCMSMLIPDYSKLKQAILNGGIRTDLFMGRYDKVIPLAYAEAFSKKCPMQNCTS